jgi:hypothetical protein
MDIYNKYIYIQLQYILLILRFLLLLNKTKHLRKEGGGLEILSTFLTLYKSETKHQV